MKKLIAGNWKMNGTLDSARKLAAKIAAGLEKDRELALKCDFVVCPPFPYLAAVHEALGGRKAVAALGGQDCAAASPGAYTGDVAPEMLVDLDCDYVILGHSERRQFHGETDEQIAAKAQLAHQKGLKTIICVGEKESERNAGLEEDVVGTQLEKALPPTVTEKNTVIAYEPVWAIGTGKTATPDDVARMHKFIRKKLKERLEDSAAMRILYGGSVKPDNAAALLAVENVDGALIGGASLKAEDYLAIAAGA